MRRLRQICEGLGEAQAKETVQGEEVSDPYHGSAEESGVTRLVKGIPLSGSAPDTLGREGDFIELRDGAIFEVKGLVHPPDRLIAYPRYIPDEQGDRVKDSRRYRKVYPLHERYALLRQRYSQLLVRDSVFDTEMPEVPLNEILVHHRPGEALARLLNETHSDDAAQCATSLASLISSRSGVPFPGLGISGSVMVGLHTPSSDIDIIVYGHTESSQVREAMKRLLSEGDPVRPYRPDEMKRLHRFRAVDTPIPYSEFVRHEARKTFQGMYQDREFFIRYLPRPYEFGETYGDARYHSEGLVKVKAEVENASESFFTPCRYRLARVDVVEGSPVPDIVEAVSFRGRFCEQAEAGETVMLRGKLERVDTAEGSYRRILLGGGSSDIMISLSLQKP
jgi:predicted nucleotidyltransferase